MKSLFLILAGLLTGCSSPTSDKSLESKAAVASAIAISSRAQQPQLEPALKTAYDHIQNAANAETVSPSDVVIVFHLLSMTEFKSDSLLIFPVGTTVVVQESGGMSGVVEKPEQLRGILRGIATGIRLARPSVRPVGAPPLPFSDLRREQPGQRQ